MYHVFAISIKNNDLVGKYETLDEAKLAKYPPMKYGKHIIMYIDGNKGKCICYRWIGCNEWLPFGRELFFTLIHGGLHGQHKPFVNDRSTWCCDDYFANLETSRDA
ncbi:MAG: hypothetical protein LBR22_00350 [Desulfovibrio sp.]|jgi:hypothetical protein|nr:hypothetical protein [Desulfovibrio sp.]